MTPSIIMGYLLIIAGVVLIVMRALKLGLIGGRNVKVLAGGIGDADVAKTLIKAIKDPVFLIGLVLVIVGALLINPAIIPALSGSSSR